MNRGGRAMRKLPKPIEDPIDVLLTCTYRSRNMDLKSRLTAAKDVFAAAATQYEMAAASAQLHTLVPECNVAGTVTCDEMKRVYNEQMVAKNSPGRPIYDRLLASPRFGICPLCGQRLVSTLDHHLPQASFPALVVVPTNLVPSCSDCNRTKHSAVPHKAGEQTLHPYFDDVESDRWLYAEVLSAPAATLRFYVDPPAYWDPVKSDRVRYHFRLFRLARLYASQAGNELVNIRDRLSSLHKEAGRAKVEMHLKSEADSRIAANCNSWQAAMYTALASNSWYCSGGFLLDSL